MGLCPDGEENIGVRNSDIYQTWEARWRRLNVKRKEWDPVRKRDTSLVTQVLRQLRSLAVGEGHPKLSKSRKLVPPPGLGGQWCY